MVQVARLAGIEAGIVSKAAQAGTQIESKLQVMHTCDAGSCCHICVRNVVINHFVT